MTRVPAPPPAPDTAAPTDIARIEPLSIADRQRAAREWREAVLLRVEGLCAEFPQVPPGTVLSTSLACYRELCRIAGPEQWARSTADLAGLVQDTARMRLRRRA